MKHTIGYLPSVYDDGSDGASVLTFDFRIEEREGIYSAR